MMEVWQKQTILTNLSALQGYTLANSDFLAIFISEGILTCAEVESLNALENSKKAAELYKLIPSRVAAFEVLIDALQQTKQSGALLILQTAIQKNLTLANVVDGRKFSTAKKTEPDDKTSKMRANHEPKLPTIQENDQLDTVEAQNLLPPKPKPPSQITVSNPLFRVGFWGWKVDFGVIVTAIILIITSLILTVHIYHNHSKNQNNSIMASPQPLGLNDDMNSTLRTTPTIYVSSLKTRSGFLPSQTTDGIPSPASITTGKESFTPGIVWLQACSLTEYSQKVLDLSKETTIGVNISLKSPYDWPNHIGILDRSDMIVNLTLSGPFTLKQIIDILSQLSNLEHLHLVDTGKRTNLCGRNKGQLSMAHSISVKVSLPILKTLIIEEFASCVEIYETLAVALEPLINLKEMELSYGIIDSSNIFAIIKLFMLAKNSLEHFLLPNTLIKSNSLSFEEEVDGVLMPHVKQLRLDNIEGKLNIGSQFSKVFPNLQSFSSEQGFISWHSTKNVLNCKNLASISVMIHSPDVTFNVSLLQTFSSGLKNANITLKFSLCDHDSIPNIIGLENLGDLCITVWSNCKILVNLSKVPTQKLVIREWKFDKENTWSKFTYIERSALVKNRGYYCADYFN